MDYETASADDIDSVVPEEYGSMHFFRDALGCEGLGVTLLELESGAKGKPHDHAGDDHEEVYLVVDGELTITLGDEDDHTEEVTLTTGEAIRVGSETHRQLHNRGETRVRAVLSGAP